MRAAVRLAVAAFAVSACGPESDGGPDDGRSAGHTVRDSAGIELVESHEPLWGDEARWRVDSLPTVEVSGADDPDLYRLGGPRLLRDGRLVVFNGGTCEVRFYDPAGLHLLSVGRCGEGPGEFAASAGVRPWRGDSLLVIDRITRVTILSREGRIDRTLTLPTSPEIPLPIVRGVLDGGRLLITSPRDPAGRDSPGMERATLFLGLLDDLSRPARLLETLPGALWVYSEYAGSLTRGRLPFSGTTELAAGQDRFFVGSPDRYQIEVRDADGSLERIIRRAFEPVEVEQRDIDWLMERRLSEVGDAEGRRLVRRAYRDLEYAERMPAFGTPEWPGGAEGGPSMLADEAGNLWVFCHYRPGRYRNDWDVFSPEGVWLGVVRLPAKLVPSQIGEDFVVGSWTDETGFEHVGVFDLVKP